MKKVRLLFLGLLLLPCSALPTALEDDLSEGFESEKEDQAFDDPNAQLFRMINLEADLIDGIPGINEAIENLVNYHSAAVDAENDAGNRPLHLAAAFGLDNVVTILLDLGATIDAKNGDERTPLRVAIREGQLVTAQVLLDRGAHVSKAAICSCRINWGSSHPFVKELQSARREQCAVRLFVH